MSRRAVALPADIPSADDIFASEDVWNAVGAGGTWPWEPATQVYFLQGRLSGLIRIGIAKDLKARIASHQSSSSEPLDWLGDMPGGLPLERQLHAAFKHLRVNGSWYRPERDLLDTIARVVVL